MFIPFFLSTCTKPVYLVVYNNSKAQKSFRIKINSEIKGPYKSDSKGMFDEKFRIYIDKSLYYAIEFQIKHPCGWVTIEHSISNYGRKNKALTARDTTVTRSFFEIVVDNRNMPQAKLSIGKLDFEIKENSLMKIHSNVPNCEKGRVIKLNENNIFVLPEETKTTYGLITLPTYLLDTSKKRCYETNYLSNPDMGAKNRKFNEEFNFYKKGNNLSLKDTMFYMIEPAIRGVSIYKRDYILKFETDRSANLKNYSNQSPYYWQEIQEISCK